MPPTEMSPLVFAAVLSAAAMHAGWNAFLKVRLEPFLAMTLIAGCSGLAAIPLLLVFGLPNAESMPWLAASTVLHLLYYLALTEAYRRADMGQIYPIARGTAPLLTASLSLLLLGEALSPQVLAGIVVLGGGIIVMSVTGRRPGSAFDPVAVAFALLTATIICGYTLVDGLGARAARNPHAYTALLFVLDGLPLVLFALWRKGLAGLKPILAYLPNGVAGGALSMGSYWIAIWAMTVAPIALVAALRETSVLFAALIAVFVLGEPFIRRRGVAVALILAGLVLIRLG
ncbi:EamA family transporter [Alsobacter sp. SYSU M60028]|uniref:EamA family transporter n=1 Tax=Alsobacter ponti TaxID=2962936 RepID=A0ABT1LEJ0_9HYPH|nr:EamA family transporter [Alsobacter ponti]MCP8939849.1 EamA family transporter [Alsobacter ponti]